MLGGETVKHGTSRSWIITRAEMKIKREDLIAGRTDLADIATAERLPAIHPGEILRDGFLQPMGISVYTLAQFIKVPRSRVNDVVLVRGAITIDTALRLARFFGTTPEFWINLQTHYELELAVGSATAHRAGSLVARGLTRDLAELQAAVVRRNRPLKRALTLIEFCLPTRHLPSSGFAA
jgi:addiction module HigA family antidote